MPENFKFRPKILRDGNDKIVCTVKLGNKERFDKEHIGIKKPFPVINLPFSSFLHFWHQGTILVQPKSSLLPNLTVFYVCKLDFC